MNRTYVRGNKEHWKEVFEYAWGKKPDEDYEMSCYADDKCIILKYDDNLPWLLYEENSNYGMYKMLYDAITTNPHWHEVKPWEHHSTKHSKCNFSKLVHLLMKDKFALLFFAVFAFINYLAFTSGSDLLIGVIICIDLLFMPFILITHYD